MQLYIDKDININALFYRIREPQNYKLGLYKKIKLYCVQVTQNPYISKNTTENKGEAAKNSDIRQLNLEE